MEYTNSTTPSRIALASLYNFQAFIMQIRHWFLVVRHSCHAYFITLALKLFFFSIAKVVYRFDL